MEYRPKAGECVRALLVSSLGLPAEAFASGISDTVEGVVLSVNEAKGTIIVKDDDGEWDCLAVGAFPLPQTVIIATRVGRDGTTGAWEARVKDKDTPVGYGATSDEAVGKLKLHFPSLVKGAVVEKRGESAQVGC